MTARGVEYRKVNSMERIFTHDKSFVDEYGRERIFSGINAVDKEPYREGKLTVDFENELSTLDRFRDDGFNILRLGTTWSAIEPAPGMYNDKLIASIKRVMDACEERGIYVFIDMHQDLYSGDINCVGDGAPLWAVLTDGAKTIKPKFVWAEPYFWGRACHKAFDNFWNNKPYKGKGLLDYYACMWQHLASEIGDHPALFGFDLLNEPFPGTDGGKIFRTLVAKVISLTLTDKRINKKKLVSDALFGEVKIKAVDQYNGDVLQSIASSAYPLVRKFDTEKYMPFLDKTSTAIRKATSNGILFVDNCYYSNLSIPCSNRPINVDGKRDANQCFSPHGYDFMVDTPMYKYALSDRIKAIFDEHKRTQYRMRVPVVVGEWGGNSEGTEWLPHVEFILDMFDENKWSQTYWTYVRGMLDLPVSKVLRRPYPRAVTGTVEKYFHDREKNEFTLIYDQQEKFKVPTVIFAHKPVKSVETDGKYTINKISETSSEVIVTTKPGKHTVRVIFE